MTRLESLSDARFAPLATEEAAQIRGGATVSDPPTYHWVIVNDQMIQEPDFDAVSAG
ncbi:hypothetical protein [Longimicrobium sp.]|uniref:hypothetical protein n=1 Tax=Longimicrobium sp. TaxID=2029185 RepID=UPI002B7A18FC|nr:hypothetical protein [Longimicrobium sp.]HSU12865.1 hypothetical protein [Longimicrobium sp.]